MYLSDKDAHCIARMLQSTLYGGSGSVFNGCAFCKYCCYDRHLKFSHEVTNYEHILKLLTEGTGVDLMPGVYGAIQLEGFPYKKFLKDSNEPIKEYFRNLFKDV